MITINWLLFLATLTLAGLIALKTRKALKNNAFPKKYLRQLFFFISTLIAISIVYLIINHFSEPKIYLLTQLIAAIGTLGVITLSLWGDSIKSILQPIHFELTWKEESGEITNEGAPQSSDPRYAVYYHLIVVNKGAPYTIKYCSVELKHIRLLDIHSLDIKREREFIAPYCFKWSNTHHDGRDQNKYKNFTKEAVIDLVRYDCRQQRIYPVLTDNFHEFHAFFQEVPYVLELELHVRAENYESEKTQCFRITCNGTWSDNPNDITHQVKIQAITPATPFHNTDPHSS